MTPARTERAAQSAELLGSAVHRHRAWSLEGSLERVFTLAFRGLVYPQIWEDPRVDLEALQITPQSRIVTIASGGCNVLSYLEADPARIMAVDLNRAHVALNRLKLAAVEHLADHAELFSLIGRADARENVELYRSKLAPKLDAETRAYWEARTAAGRPRIAQLSRNFYRYGLLGRFIGLGHAIARLHGRDPRRLMAARTLEEQRTIFERELAPLFDKPLVRWALGHRAALYGLGIPPAQYAALLGDSEHMADVVRARLRRLACDFALSDNYFAWQAFNRAYAPTGEGPLPPYLQADRFAPLRERVSRVSVELISFMDFLGRQPAASLDRFVLLDAQDWMSDRELTKLWTQLTRTARPGARVIFRTAGVPTILPGRVPNDILGRWSYDQTTSARLTAADRSAIYGGFHLYVLRDHDGS